MRGEAILGAAGHPVEDVKAWLARLQATAARLGLGVQALDADAVCGLAHLLSALAHAHRAFERGKNLARTLEVEWALCAAGMRQVGPALKRVGVRRGTTRFALLVLYEGELVLADAAAAALMAGAGLWPDDGALGFRPEALRRLGVTEAELAAVPRERWQGLALERVALLDLER
jgi:KEOPS complex subunit Cgi121